MDNKLILGLVLAYCAVAVLAGTCAIDGSTYFQAIDGFGFSSAWCGKLSAAKNDALYNTLGMSILRIRIDQSRAWADETANSAAAHAAGAVVLGSEWSPPVAWNSNGKSTGGYLLPSHYADYANWLKQAGDSIKLDYISFQNEPDIGGVAWTAAQMKTFVQSYATTIGYPLVYPESFHFDDSYSDPVLNDPATVNLIKVVGGHIYGSGNTVHQNAINKGKNVWMTEYYINGMNTVQAALDIGKNIQQCLNNQMSAYIWWWSNDNDLNVNLVFQNGTINKNGYTIGQFAKFIRPGKKRISATYQPTTNVFVTAYRTGGVVIVAVNANTSPVSQAFSMTNVSGVASFLIHRTSASENMANVGSVTVTNSSTFTYTLPAQSITTFHQY